MRLPAHPRRRLLRDPRVSDAHYKSCMERMLGSAQKLSGLLHGQAVRDCRCAMQSVSAQQPDRHGCVCPAARGALPRI